MDGALTLLAVLFFVDATLYASVGHAGGSGYLAAMAIVGVAPESMRPLALVTNVVVATIGTVRFARAGWFDWRTFWPFALGSVPFAFVGGGLRIPSHVLAAAIGVVLLFAAVRLGWTALARGRDGPEPPTRPVPVAVGVACGAVVGLAAGITGTGGGIFLSPIVVLLGWAQVRTASAVAAAFILVNSVAGIAADTSAVRALPSATPVLVLCAAVGGLLGSELGARRFSPRSLRVALAVVLLAAGTKLILT